MPKSGQKNAAVLVLIAVAAVAGADCADIYLRLTLFTEAKDAVDRKTGDDSRRELVKKKPKKLRGCACGDKDGQHFVGCGDKNGSESADAYRAGGVKSRRTARKAALGYEPDEPAEKRTRTARLSYPCVCAVAGVVLKRFHCKVGDKKYRQKLCRVDKSVKKRIDHSFKNRIQY